MNTDFNVQSFIFFDSPWNWFRLIQHLNSHFEESLYLVFFRELIFHLVFNNLDASSGHVCEANSLYFLYGKIVA